MKLVSWTGRLLGKALGIERWKIGQQIGNDDLNRARGMDQVFEAMFAEIDNLTAAGRRFLIRTAVACEATIWPPAPTAMSRAARLRAPP